MHDTTSPTDVTAAGPDPLPAAWVEAAETTDGTEVGPNGRGLGRRGWLWVIGISVAMAALILPAIGRKSLWRDEGFSVSTVLRPWGSLFRLMFEQESNASLHSVLLKAWSGFGSSEAVLRLPSAFAVIAAVAVVAMVANRLANRNVAIVAALLFAMHGSVFAYGQQIRAYAFTVLFASLAALFFAADVRRPSRGALVAWVVVCLLLTYSNLMAVSLPLSQLASLLVLPASLRSWRRRLIAGGIVVALTAPLALLISTHNEGGIYEFGLGTFWDVLMVLTGRSGFLGILGIGVLGIVAIRTTVRVFRHGGSAWERWVHTFCIAWVVGPFVLAFLVSLVDPILTGRYMMISVPGICIYGAIGLIDLFRTYATSSTAGRVVRLGVATLVALASVGGVALWLRGGEVEDWREASRYVIDHGEQGDGVLFANDSVRLFFEYYRTHAGPDLSAKLTPVFPADPWGDYETGDHRYVSFDADQVAEAAAASDRLWVVVGRQHVNTGGVDDALEQGLGQTHHLVAEQHFNGLVDVLLFERTA